jgi:hypothetical protein
MVTSSFHNPNKQNKQKNMATTDFNLNQITSNIFGKIL